MFLYFEAYSIIYHVSYVMNFFHLFQVSSKRNLAPFTTTICTCLYITFVHDTSMYIYINACICQGLNPRFYGNAPIF